MAEAERPITPLEAYDGNYWRRRSRRLLEQACDEDPVGRRALLKFAAECDTLAVRADLVRHQIDLLDIGIQ